MRTSISGCSFAILSFNQKLLLSYFFLSSYFREIFLVMKAVKAAAQNKKSLKSNSFSRIKSSLWNHIQIHKSKGYNVFFLCTNKKQKTLLGKKKE